MAFRSIIVMPVKCSIYDKLLRWLLCLSSGPAEDFFKNLCLVLKTQMSNLCSWMNWWHRTARIFDIHFQFPRGVLDRNGANSFNANGYPGQTVDIIVENQGRLNYGGQINDNKKVLTWPKIYVVFPESIFSDYFVVWMLIKLLWSVKFVLF